MSGPAVLRGRRALLLAVLVTGLLCGLVGMHHLAVTSGPPGPVATSSHGSGPDGPTERPVPPHGDEGHATGLLHLCLAILTAVAVLVASMVSWRRSRAILAAPRAGLSRLWTAPRAPPPTAPARLALLCVLRT